MSLGLAAGLRAGFGKASQPRTPIGFDVPARTCDCHTHIFADPARFPLWEGRSFTPETALPEEMAALHRALHVERVVIVTPSCYGTDNAATLYGIKARGANARGVAVIGDKTTESELDAMQKAGMRGIRLNFATGAQPDLSGARQRFQAFSARVKRLGWHVQIYTGLAMISGLKDLILDSAVPVVIDHFGSLRAELGLQQPGFSDMVEMVRSGKAYVKISGAYRCSNRTPDYADVAPFAKTLISANADRILWGTDWPHPDPAVAHKPTDIAPLMPIDDGALMNLLPVWVPDAALRKHILVDNPTRLYGF